MKKLALLALIVCLVTGQSAWAIVNAQSYTFSPNPANLQNLEHAYYYSWGIQADLNASDIVGARLTIDNINDWQVESNDHLFVHMLDTAPTLSNRISSNVTRGTDNEGGGDRFAGQGTLLVDYSDTNDYTERVRVGWWWQTITRNPAEDLIYDLTATDLISLRGFLADGAFGLAFDPDCHYYNDGISFTIYTQPHETVPPVVPEPATGALMLIGMGGMAAVRRLRRRAN